MMQKRTDPGHHAGRMGARQIYEALRDQIMSLWRAFAVGLSGARMEEGRDRRDGAQARAARL